jgi:hypothetical protein
MPASGRIASSFQFCWANPDRRGKLPSGFGSMERMEGDTMLALAMVLATAMTVPGNGPEKVSGEMVRERQPLNLQGKWKATVYWRGPVIKGEASVVEQQFRVEFGKNNHVEVRAWRKPIDEGNGNLRMGRNLGIYEQDGNRLRICISTLDDESRPTSFHADEKQCLLILHRVKPRK